MARKSAQDWLDIGLRTLAKEGLGGLTIDSLSLALGVTKGSFYHHFRNTREFEAQLLAHWASQYQNSSAAVPGDPAVCLTLLDTIMAEAFDLVTGPEVAIRMWATQDELARHTVSHVDAMRHRFVLAVFRCLVGDEEQAEMMADIFSTMLIGSMTILPQVPPARVLALYQEFKQLYGLLPPFPGITGDMA